MTYRKISLMIQSTYRISALSSKVGNRSPPVTRSISSWAFFATSGWWTIIIKKVSMLPEDCVPVSAIVFSISTSCSDWRSRSRLFQPKEKFTHQSVNDRRSKGANIFTGIGHSTKDPDVLSYLRVLVFFHFVVVQHLRNETGLDGTCCLNRTYSNSMSNVLGE